jgi:ribosome-binding factor A
MANQRRQYRVAEQARSSVAMALLRLSDPRLALVTVTAAKTTSDLRLIKVYWSVSGGPERIEEVEEALDSAQGVLRREVGHDLGLRSVPVLEFYYDETLDVIAQSRALMQKVADEDAARKGKSKEEDEG